MPVAGIVTLGGRQQVPKSNPTKHGTAWSAMVNRNGIGTGNGNGNGRCQWWLNLVHGSPWSAALAPATAHGRLILSIASAFQSGQVDFMSFPSGIRFRMDPSGWSQLES
jgi:hypothetical protein